MVDQERKKSRVSMTVPKGGLTSNTNKSMAMLSSKSIGKLTGMKSMSRMRMRRLSYGFGGIGGIRGDIARSSQIAIEYKRPPLLYLNTYQLDPHPDQVFSVPRVTNMVNNVLNNLWNGHKYNYSETPALALKLAGEMMQKVKNMGFNRYRIISVVTIGEKRAQSYNNAVTFLWDHERDNYVNVYRECNTNFIQVTIFGVYLD